MAAKDKTVGYRDDATTGSTPSGQGGRVRRPLHINDEGIPTLVDPENLIYSGMTKRHAIETGSFIDIDFRDED